MNNLNKTTFVETNIKILIFLIFSFLFFITNLDANAEYYSWKDEKGVTHITDNIEKIPNKYRKNAKKYESSENTVKQNLANNYQKALKLIIVKYKQNKVLFLAIISSICVIFLYKILKKQFLNVNPSLFVSKNKDILKSEIDNMDLNSFRSNVIKILENKNYQVSEYEAILNPAVDYIATKNLEKVTVTIDDSTNPLSIFRLNEINRDKHKFLCKKSIIFSRNYFDKEVFDFAKKNNIELYDKAKLAKLFLKLK